VNVDFNVNGYVRVRLTDTGKQIHKAQKEAFMAMFPAMGERYPYEPPKEDEDGWSTWQLWHLMQTFGADIHLGGNQPFETTIQFVTK